MNPYSSFIPLSLLMIPFFIPAIQAQNLINSSCKTVSQSDPNIDYNFCTTSLQAAGGRRCATVDCLVAISLLLLQNNVTDTRCYIKDLIQTGDSRQCLDDCLDVYSPATEYVEDAIQYYDANRFVDANRVITAVMDAATTCNECRVVSPLKKRNDDVFQLSAMVLAAMRLIKRGSAAI